MPDVLGTLRVGRERIVRGWCQETLAEDVNGEGCDELSAEAVSWCAMGAVCVLDLDTRSYALDELNLGVDTDIAGWNDHPDRTQAEVLDLFDRTIARVESEAGRMSIPTPATDPVGQAIKANRPS